MLRRPQDGGPIQDGFTLNPAWYPNPADYQFLAMAGLDVLRRANQMQTKWIVLPEQGASIAARDTYEYDAVVIPGTVLWGVMLSELSAVGGSVTSSANAMLRLTDACTGFRILDDFSIATRPFSNYWAGTSLRGTVQPFILPSPYMIAEPGRLFVEIANQSASAINARLILFLAEPCDMTAYTAAVQR